MGAVWNAKFVGGNGVCNEDAGEIESPDALPPLPRDAALALFRIVQEALTNIAKHAQASHVRITIAHRAGEVEATVEDDGVGIAMPQVPGRSHGLLNMRERARSVHGEVAISPRDGASGTRVALRIPAPAPASDGQAG